MKAMLYNVHLSSIVRPMKYKIFILVIFLLISLLGNRIFAEINSTNETYTSNFEIYYPSGQERPHVLKDYVYVKRNKNKTVIDISSEFEIGTVRIFLVEGSWPEKIAVHLHLTGLEGFSVTNGKIVLERHEVTVNALDNNGNLINQKYLLKQAGFYEVMLPSSLFDKETREITISWVDFYRV